jgi:hypothetical protein
MINFLKRLHSGKDLLSCMSICPAYIKVKI